MKFYGNDSISRDISFPAEKGMDRLTEPGKGKAKTNTKANVTKRTYCLNGRYMENTVKEGNLVS